MSVVQVSVQAAPRDWASDAPAAAARLAAGVTGASIDELLDIPFVWIGTEGEIRERLRAHKARFGIDRYVVRAPALRDVRQFIGDETASHRVSTT